MATRSSGSSSTNRMRLVLLLLESATSTPSRTNCLTSFMFRLELRSKPTWDRAQAVSDGALLVRPALRAGQLPCHKAALWISGRFK